MTHLTPVYLEIFARQSLEAYGNIGEGALLFQLETVNVLAKDRTTSPIGLHGVTSR